MSVNVAKLHKELESAGLPLISVRSTGECIYSRTLTKLESDQAKAIIQSHDSTDLVAQREFQSIEQARRVGVFKTVTPDQATAWIDKNVTDLPSAKQALKEMASMMIAMRNKLWPGLADE